MSRGVKRQWDCRQRQVSACSLAISSETLEIRPALLYSDKQYLGSFSLILKCMTLNDLVWLFHVKLCFRAGTSVASETAKLRISKIISCKLVKCSAESLFICSV